MVVQPYIKIMKNISLPKIKKENMVLPSGGVYDKTRCYAPSILKYKDEYLLYYTGSNDNPSERSGYRLLLAKSKDGINFEKTNKVVLDFGKEAKCYSAEAILQNDGRLKLYFALNKGDGYKIFKTTTDDYEDLSGEFSVAIEKTELFSHSVHTLRTIEVNGLHHAYVAGSSNGARSQSKKYKHYKIGSDFRIFHAASDSGEVFNQFEEIVFPPHNFINIYGHSVFLYKDTLYLIFTGFDGSAGCKLYISTSKDFKNFSEPELLLVPDEENGEIGMYSCSVLQLSKNSWRIFYGSRAAWKYLGIASALLTFADTE